VGEIEGIVILDELISPESRDDFGAGKGGVWFRVSGWVVGAAGLTARGDDVKRDNGGRSRLTFFKRSR